MKDQYKLWFEYDLEANVKMINPVLANGDVVPADCIHLLSHNIAAHETWNSRVEKREAVKGVWEGVALDEMLAFVNVNFKNSLHILDTMELETEIQYANTKGELFVNTIGDIFTHVLMHAMYHRGQIARSLRAANIAPPETNYISFRR